MSCSAKRDPNGTWHIQYRWTDWTGTKKKSQKRGFKTKKEAEEWYAHFILQQTSDPTMTLNDFWGIYKADMEKRLRKTTMKQKEYVMKDKVSMQLSTLKRELLEEMESIYGKYIWKVYMEMPYLLLHRPEIIEMRWNKKQQECQRQICRMQ